MLVNIARWTQKSVPERAAALKKPQMLSIPYSHYVELARWSMLLGGVDFDEYGYVPGQHVLPVLNLRWGGEKKHVAKSSSVSYAAGGKNNPTGVPVLVMPDGCVHNDSWDIANQASGLAPLLDSKSKHFYDTQLGPDVRQMAYNHFLAPTNEHVWHKMASDSVLFGSAWSWTWSLGVGSLMTTKLRDMFKCDNAAAVAATQVAVEKHFSGWLSERVERKSGKYLNGDEISVEDVAFASLCAVAVMPNLYCGGKFQAYFDEIVEADESIRQTRDAVRSTAAGRYVLWFYEQHRPAGLAFTQ